MIKTIAIASAIALTAGAASAASITVELFTQDAYDAYVSSFARTTVEDFEGFAGAVGTGAEVSPVTTAVGTFTTIGATGSGGSVIGGGDALTVRTQGSNGFGRVNTTVGGSYYLDSNDTFGVDWDAMLGNGAAFNSLAFSLSDAADQGARLRISAGGDELETLLNLPNGNVQFVVVSFENAVTGASIELANMNAAGTMRTNDGFGIDDVVIAAVPVPAAGLLLLGGLGALRLRSRRKA